MADRHRVASIRLGPTHRPTVRAQHYYGTIRDGRLVPTTEVPVPAALEIVRFAGDDGCYLLYLDEDGNELTDTYHATLEDALDQAHFEFEVVPSDWELG